MDIWEEKFGISKNLSACKKTATCCLAATSVSPWIKINRAKNNQNLRDFFNIFIPYDSSDKVQKTFPEAYRTCMEVAESRSDVNKEEIYFYHCRFLKPPNHCQIYEDRPNLCRDYPDSPFDSISSTCGYYGWAKQCKKKLIELQLELMNAKLKEFSNYKIYLISPNYSWLR